MEPIFINITSSPNPSQPDDEITFVVEVTSNGNPVTEGNLSVFTTDGDENVIIYDGGLNPEGKIITNYTFETPGMYTIYALYYVGNPPIIHWIVSFQLVLNPALTQTTTNIALPTGEVNQEVSFNIEVLSDNGVPTGTVFIFVYSPNQTDTWTDWKDIDDDGEATFTYTFTQPGTYTAAAVYFGDRTTYNPSWSEYQSFEILPASTTVTLTSNYNPSWYGQLVTFTAQIDPAQEGLMGFFVDNVLVASVNVDSNGIAKYQTATLTPGAHQVVAVFSGNFAFSNIIGQTVLYCCCKC